MRFGLLATFGLAVIVTWPMAIDPTGGLLGHPGNDVWNHVWGFWWVGEELRAGHVPLITDLLRFPGTSKLFFIDTFGALWTLPVQRAFGPVAAYNLACFVGFWLSGFASWLLCRHVCEGRFGAGDQPALVGATAFMLGPHLVAQAYNGISETLTAGTFALAIWTFVRLLERPTLLAGLAAAAAGALCMVSNAYYGLFAALGAVVLTITTVAGRWEQVHWRGLPAPIVVGAAIAAALVAPSLWLLSESLEGPSAIVNRDPQFVWRSLISHNITDLVSVFRPGRTYSPDLKAEHGEDLLIVTYVGWVTMALAGFGLWSLRRGRDRWPWLAWTAVFGSLMLGPYLYVGGEYLTISDRRIPLPFLIFFDAFPIFSRISHPFRFVVPVQLGLAVLATLGARRLPWVWGLRGAGALLAVELLLLSPAPWPIARSPTEIPESTTIMGDDPEAGAVLDLPMGLPNLERAIYNYWQIAHARPSPYSLNEPNPEVLERSRLARALRVAEAGRLDRLPPQLPELDLVVSGRALARLGVRYVVMHERFYLRERAASTLVLLRVALGPETTTTADGDHLWRLSPPAQQPVVATDTVPSAPEAP
ncbi:MAG: hypothetical protein EXR71_07825 [Myxococcales bacterium]|nr:hypothetical protein [Myxococcales bacterium]